LLAELRALVHSGRLGILRGVVAWTVIQEKIQRLREMDHQIVRSPLSEWLEEVPNGSNIVLQLHKLPQFVESRSRTGRPESSRETRPRSFEQVLDRKIAEAEWLAGGTKKSSILWFWSR
jgi:hypothetical protein